MLSFDARQAKALQAGDHLIFDSAPGLRLVATESTRTWTYRFKDPVSGRMRQVRLGHWPAMSWSAAVGAWEAARRTRAAGDDPRGQPVTVDALAALWLAAHEPSVAPKTARESRRLLTVDAAIIGHRLAASITRADAFDLLDRMRDRPVVAQQLRQRLGAVWDYGLDSGRLPAETPNWWRLVLRGKLASRGKRIAGVDQGTSKRALDDAEVAALLAWLPNFSRDVCDALTLYLWTLCRGSEIVGMGRSEVAREADGILWWTVPRERLKMRRNDSTADLRVPLFGRAEAVVLRRLEAARGEFLFPSPGRAGHIQQKAVGVAVWYHMPYSTTRPEVHRPRLPVTHWAPHDLRRTGRTMLAAMGCSNEVGEALLGHAQPGIVGVYNRHSYDADRVRWLQAWSARLDALATTGRGQ